eukprot:1930765-Rhodomonas_salina.2
MPGTPLKNGTLGSCGTGMWSSHIATSCRTSTAEMPCAACDRPDSHRPHETSDTSRISAQPDTSTAYTLHRASETGALCVPESPVCTPHSKAKPAAVTERSAVS